jgi:hypothetical protein
MLHCMTAHERDIYLAQKSEQVVNRMQILLAGMPPEDVRTMPPADRALLAEVLERLPEAIPAGLVAPLRAALAQAEAAA